MKKFEIGDKVSVLDEDIDEQLLIVKTTKLLLKLLII